MRLIKIHPNGDLSLTNDLINDIPPYAILSHVWLRNNKEEVKYQEMRDGGGRDKEGFKKIEFCARQARRDGLEYCWVDTCGIDKSSSAELSEAINSMFKWYANAQKCYVYLSDVSTRKRGREGEVESTWRADFEQSRWFRRGWTLQELLAPRMVEFYSSEETSLGTKESLADLVFEITRIPLSAVRGAPLSSFPVSARRAWVNGRETTREEDLAYCMLGILDVSLPVVYGEGDHAWTRLRDALIRSFGDELGTFSSATDAGRVNRAQLERVNGIAVMLESLSFEQISAREAMISEAHESTCGWFLQHPLFCAWQSANAQNQPHHRFLWVNGNPGVGKSTLMKYAYDFACMTASREKIVVAFFFNARGSELERSTVGMYRSLLYQLLNAANDMQDLLAPAARAYERLRKRQSWNVTLLCQLLKAAVKQLGRRTLECFIDALDECAEEEIGPMVKFLESLVRTAEHDGVRVRICLASRHYPTITIRLGSKMILEHEQGHLADMVEYVEANFDPEPSDFVNKIKRQILEKANGVFMWVVLVIDMLNDVFREGRIFALRRRLEEIPKQLNEVIREMLTRDNKHQREFQLSIQWLLFSSRPLTPQEYYYALVAGLDASVETVGRRDPNVITDDYIVRFIRESSKGLAETTKSSPQVVQFIHESVRDYFLKENGFRELFPDCSKGKLDFSVISHERLMTCCYDYLNINGPLLADPFDRMSDNTLPRAVDSKLPFAEYACTEMLVHADEAARSSHQGRFILTLTSRPWSFAIEAFCLPGSDRCYQGPGSGHSNLLSVACELHCARLAKQWCEVRVQDVRRLDSTLGTPLSYVVRFDVEDVPMMNLLLSHGAAVDAKHHMDRTALIAAAATGATTLVQILLARHANVEASDTDGRTALIVAAEAGFNDIVQQLLDHNADLQAFDDDGRTALHCAADHGNEEMVDFLLSSGANIDAIDTDGCTALILAASGGDDWTCLLLLKAGANVHRRDHFDQTALDMAKLGGWTAAARVLEAWQGIPLSEYTDDEDCDAAR
ncbi:hypothetical protein LTS10_008231 [Elasticomyces elasticus]|nr:hypothetical protein LTS10_008231 [Elasticomyces elasticus]